MEQLTDITNILEVVILVIIAPLVPIIVAQVKRWVDTNVSQHRREMIQQAVRVGVLAVEQMGLSGKEAKNRAIALVSDCLAQHGVRVDFATLSALIEAEVMSQFNIGRAKKQ